MNDQGDSLRWSFNDNQAEFVHLARGDFPRPGKTWWMDEEHHMTRRSGGPSGWEVSGGSGKEELALPHEPGAILLDLDCLKSINRPGCDRIESFCLFSSLSTRFRRSRKCTDRDVRSKTISLVQMCSKPARVQTVVEVNERGASNPSNQE
jgi:hypothetical protein